MLKLMKDCGFIGIEIGRREELEPKKESSKDFEADIYAAISRVILEHGYDLEEFSFKKNFEIETPQRELVIRAVKSL